MKLLDLQSDIAGDLDGGDDDPSNGETEFPV